MRFECSIAGRHLRSMRGRARISFTMTIAGVGVALGVAALVIVLSVMNGYSKMIWGRLLGINAHLTVEKAYSEKIEDHRGAVNALRTHDEVRGVSPFIRSEGFVFSRGGNSKTSRSGVLVRGVSEEGLVQTTDIQDHLRQGEISLGPTENAKEFGILIGRVLAEKLKAELGSEVYLGLIPKETTLGPMIRWRKYRVTGIFDTGYYEFDAKLLFVSLDAARRDVGWGDRVTGIHLRLGDPFQVERVSQEIRGILRQDHPSLFASSWMDRYGNFHILIMLQKWTFFLVLSLIVVVAGFNIISILTMNVTERRREIGILKAMGLRPERIGRIFTLEGLAVGIVGVVVGNLLGFSLCWIQWRFQVIRIPGEVYFIDSLPVEMQAFDFLMISAATLGLCYLFTLFPARDAAALDPVEAIRYE